MAEPAHAVMRRGVLQAAVVVATSGLGAGAVRAASQSSEAEDTALIVRQMGRAALPSARVQLHMPAAFSNGYSVPLSLAVDSPMTAADHVRRVCVLAPRNPIIPVAEFRFTPHSGRVAFTTRIRLAEPQRVLAVAELNDGTLLMAGTWVTVETNGCA